MTEEQEDTSDLLEACEVALDVLLGKEFAVDKKDAIRILQEAIAKAKGKGERGAS